MEESSSLLSLVQATLAAAAALLVVGLPLLVENFAAHRFIHRFPRSQITAIITMGAGTAFFLMFHVKNLSPADFGDFKLLITIVSIAILILSIVFLPDFLAVRGMCIIVLLFSREALDAAFLQDQHPTRIVVVSTVYIWIVAALYLSAWPYRLLDFLEWLFGNRTRLKTMGLVITAHGIFLGVLALTYV
tara:strand:+ start:182 stop:748 length:567 start_codon:yes stop_codon:yes gene_type:complete